MSNVDKGSFGSSSFVLSRLFVIGIVIGVVMFAHVLGELFTDVLNPQDANIINAEPTVGLMVAIAGSFVGMAVGGYTYLVITGRNIEYIDIGKPTWGTVVYTAIGSVASLLILVGFNIVVTVTGMPVAEGWVTNTIGDNFDIAVLFLVIVLLFNAPAEEFLYRGVIQKRLSEVFSTQSAVVITSLLFASVHLPAYLMTSTLEKGFPPVLVVFGGAIIFGFLYAYTENLLAPIIAHAIFNGVQIGLYILGTFA